MRASNLPVAVIAVAVCCVPLFAADPPATFDRDVKPFLTKYCADCHNADKQTSGVRVDQLDAKMEDRHLKLWATSSS